jgi:tetratricopeptide (TPR) repeat protein
VGEGWAYGSLGCAYRSLGDFSKAIEYHTRHLAIAKELGDRAGEGGAYGNLGNTYEALGDFSKAIECQTQWLAIAMEVRDRAGEGRAYGSLGIAYKSLGDFAKAIEHHTQHLAIAQELGARAEESCALYNLGLCNMYLAEYLKAIIFSARCHALATELGLARWQTSAALSMGMALRLEVQADCQRLAAGASEAPGPHSHSSSSEWAEWSHLVATCLVPEATRWLQAAFDGGVGFAKLHLAHLTFDAGQEDAALAHLKEHLSWLVQRGRATCAGCRQTRGEDAPMLTCSGCRVARFCSTYHQKMASRKAALGGNLVTGRHKDICGVLGKWRHVVKHGVAPDSCTEDLLAFLQRMRNAPTTQREEEEEQGLLLFHNSSSS